MVGVAHLVRAPVCGTGGSGFDSHHPPMVARANSPPEADDQPIVYFNAPVAQLDRAVDFESEGRRFESCRAQKIDTPHNEQTMRNHSYN